MEDAFITRLAELQSRLQRCTQSASKLLEQPTVPDGELLLNRTRLNQANETFSKEVRHCMDQGNLKSIEKITEFTREQMEAEEVLATLDTIVQQHKMNTLSATKDNLSNQPSTTKLPRLNIPHYNGDILKFHDFWDRFESSIDKSQISDADKLAYLLGALGGCALEAVEGLGTTNANYSIAVETLKQQFGDKEILIDAHYEALNNLDKANYSAEECRRVLNSLERHLRILESLGENTESKHLRVILQSKFPEEVIYELQRATQEKDNGIKTIRVSLQNIVTAMEKAKTRGVKTLPEPGTSTEALHVLSSKKKTNRKPFVPEARRFAPERIQTTSNARQSASRKMPPVHIGNPPRQHSAQLKRKMLEYPTTSHPKRSRRTCIFCNGDHYNSDCNTVKSLQQRKAKLKEKGLCFKCFRTGHISKNCRSNLQCPHCTFRHNRAMCHKKLLGKENHTMQVNMYTNRPTIKAKSFLQTATVKAMHKEKVKTCRLLLDCGAQRSYMTSRLARDLQLNAEKEDLLIIYTFGSDKPTETYSPSTNIMIETKRGVQRSIQVNIVPHITNRIPVPDTNHEIPVDIMADDNCAGQEIDLLIGNDYYFSFFREEKIKIDDDLYLIDTDFGWILSGILCTSSEENVLSVITYCQCNPGCPYFTEPDLPLREMDIKLLWTLESIGISDSPKSTREEEAVKHFNETVKYQDGRYQVKWPWTEYPPDIPTNFGLAYGRLKSLFQRLDSSMLNEYDAILKEQLEVGVIEVIDPQPEKVYQQTPPIHYLPHHIVKQQGKRGRIVYDASAKIKDQRNLNGCMYRGPSMLEDLTALLIKFRTNKVGILADVEKAFLQVGLQEEDRDVTRFLWVKDITQDFTDENVLHLRFCRVPFGIVSSPFLLTATIRYHLSRTNDRLLKEIADRCYVDNLVTGARSSNEAKKLYEETRAVFQELSMNIREWTSNDKNFMKWIPEEHRAKLTGEVKVLGLAWNQDEDTLHLRLSENTFREETINKINNKRGVLRTLASLYDPCGFASPLVLPAKLLLQELWNRKYKWDTPLSDDLIQTWETVSENLRAAKNVKIPRYVCKEMSSSHHMNFELHCFTDASKNAYSAVTYLRIDDGYKVKTAFIMSKSRVTPLHEKDDLKIPRLELLGYVIGCRLLTYVKKSLELKISKQYLWTDSLIVLSWMKSNKLLPPFVARRVNEIKLNGKIEMCYIGTDQNPADVATRPELWQQKQELWLYGPKFLLKSKRFWPDNIYLKNQQEVFCVSTETIEPDLPGTASSDESTLLEASSGQQYGYGPEQDITMEVPRHSDIKHLQSNFFPDEVAGKETHLTRNLGLFLDVEGVLRCRGRMTNTNWSYDMKHPVLIPRNSDFTEQIIKDIHERNYHVGVAHTLSLIRQNYWIPHGRAQVQKVLKKCLQCVKHGGGPYKLPPTPALPPERVSYSAPFTYTGVDYFGPVFVRTNTGKEKRWICLYTCLAVRAIHMEIVIDLTAEECLLALRRFISTRSIPKVITSDNALQFKLTADVLLQKYCTQNDIKWKFIPQLAPWHGGFYERLVGLVKHCLKRTLEKHLLKDSQMLTIIKEVEAVLNTRPLTSVGSDIEYVLKPADFLTLGKCLTIEETDSVNIPEGTFTKQSLVEGWRRGQTIIREFKNMFIGQYLANLRERYKNSCRQSRILSHKPAEVGDVVQIKGESKNRENWKVGKITALIQGSDGEYRIARVKVGNSEFTRSIGHLYPLETDLADNSKIDKQKRAPSMSLEETPMESTMKRLSRDLMDIDISGVTPEMREAAIDEVRNCPDEESIVSPRAVTSIGQTCHQSSRDTEVIENAPQESGEDIPQVEVAGETEEVRTRRKAAIRAREKIAEWTHHLFAIL